MSESIIDGVRARSGFFQSLRLSVIHTYLAVCTTCDSAVGFIYFQNAARKKYLEKKKRTNRKYDDLSKEYIYIQ